MKLNARIIFIICVLVICVIAINLAVYFQITEKPNNEQENMETVVDTNMLKENFNNIFHNQFNDQGNEVNVTKIDNEKAIVDTSYKNQETIPNFYALNVNIPYLNINNSEAQKINEEINSLFYNKVSDILSNKSQYTIYNVVYQAYINDNILSLVIHSTLKEGDNPQRVIIRTYNYNLSSNSNMGIDELLEYRKISKEYTQKKINETIQTASENANKYQKLGYSMHLRNVNDSIYLVDNTTVYFLGENKAFYILYPYGNLSYTSEVDILVI